MDLQDSKSLWKRLQSLGVYENIDSVEKYTEAFQKGMVSAAHTWAGDPLLLLTPEIIKSTHLTIFEEIHPWAGEFRGLGETVTFDEARMGADDERIESSLNEACARFADSLGNAEAAEVALHLAELHGQIRSTHPFRDGNTRTSVILLEMQIAAAYGEKFRPPLFPDSLKPLLKAAYSGRPQALAKAILEREGYPVPAWDDQNSVVIKPALDLDFETKWQKQRDEILRKQSGKSRHASRISPQAGLVLP